MATHFPSMFLVAVVFIIYFFLYIFTNLTNKSWIFSIQSTGPMRSVLQLSISWSICANPLKFVTWWPLLNLSFSVISFLYCLKRCVSFTCLVHFALEQSFSYFFITWWFVLFLVFLVGFVRVEFPFAARSDSSSTNVPLLENPGRGQSLVAGKVPRSRHRRCPRYDEQTASARLHSPAQLPPPFASQL